MLEKKNDTVSIPARDASSVSRAASCLFLLAFCFDAVAQEAEGSSDLVGHNLTPTTYTLPAKRLTVGTYVLGYGITDDWTVGTCPWLVLAYNMPMLETKFKFRTDSFFQNVSVDANYFRTFAYGRNLFEQESTFLRVTGSHLFNENYSLHTSLGHQYFFNDRKPFSLRLIPGNGSKANINLSTLNEFHITKNIGLFVELGFVGLTYSVPWLHTGLSGFFHWDWGLVQLGLSRTVSLGQVPFYADGATAMVVYWHPEMQLQILL